MNVAMCYNFIYLSLTYNYSHMELHKLITSQLQYVESGQFIVRLMTDFSNSRLDANQDPEFNALFESLKVQTPVYSKALMQIQARAESEELLRLDDIRDKKVATLRSAVNVFRYADEVAEKQAHALVMTVQRKYKDVEKMNFEAESFALSNYIEELRGPNFIGATQALGLTPHITALENANNEFKTLFSTRSTAITNTEVYDTKALRKEILGTYKDLAEYVFVMAKRKKTPFFIETLNILNTSRSYYSDIIARRKGNSK